MTWLSNLIGIGEVTLADDSGDVRQLQVTERFSGTGFADRIIDKVLQPGDFGFASVPPLGAMATMLRRAADRARGVVISTSHPASRPKNLKPGDSVMYDLRGAKVQMTEDGLLIDCAGLPAIVQNATTITLKATQKVTIDTPEAEFTGTLHAAGQISTDADVVVAGHSVAALRSAYDAHKHTGVKAGTDTSAVTDTAAS